MGAPAGGPVMQAEASASQDASCITKVCQQLHTPGNRQWMTAVPVHLLLVYNTYLVARSRSSQSPSI
jgi:hypothetical protein